MRVTSLEVQGTGSRTWRSAISNTCMSNTKVLSEGNYTNLVKLRTSTFPVKAILARGRRNLNKSCRLCGYVTETQAHVVPACPQLKDARIKRHNQVCDLLARAAERAGWNYMQEPRVRGPDGRVLKPDLVFHKDTKMVVVDPTIRYEQEDETLSEGCRDKADKYNVIRTELCAITGAADFVCLGLCLGARGSWTQKNDQFFKALGLRASLRSTFVNKAILSTLDLFKMHNDI